MKQLEDFKGIERKKIKVDMTEWRKEKESFFFHAKFIFMLNRGLPTPEKIIKEFWKLHKDQSRYSYSRGYRTGFLKGFRDGILSTNPKSKTEAKK